MDRFLYKILFITSLIFSFDAFGGSLAGKTITMTNVNEKPLIVKIGAKTVTIDPYEAKTFIFEHMKDAEVKYLGSKIPFTRPLDLGMIALGLQRTPQNNVNVDLIPGASFSAKIANPIYASPTKGAKSAS